jgi:uncharacterized protein (TIGR03086 family)
MTQMSDLYSRRAGAFEALVIATPSARWTNPSPCEGWTAAAVVAHVVDFSAHVLRERVGVDDAPAFADFDEPTAAFHATRAAVERALEDPATPAKAASYVHWSLSFDLPQHGWDLAKATGQNAMMDPEEVDLLWGALNGDPANWDWQRAKGWYGPPRPVPEDAPLQDRVLGLLGRDPNWAPPA